VTPTDNPLYDYSAIARRPPLALPGGARLALWFAVAVEHYPFGKPSLSMAPHTAELVPDPINYAWRDYGNRIGAFRLMDILGAAGAPVTAIVNSGACAQCPELIEAAVERGWRWVAHGADQSSWLTGLERDAELAHVREVTDTIEAATGQRPAGWLGPGLTATMNTSDVLAQLGYRYTLDWASDDQPFWMNVAGGSLACVPYSRELNDLPAFALYHQSGPEFAQSIVDAVDQLLIDSAGSARVLGVGLHPFLVGQPWRAIHLARALEALRERDGIWLTTSDAIADWFRAASPPGGSA